MSHWRNRFLWLALLVLAGLTSWFLIARPGGAPPAARSERPAAGLPDYSLGDATVTRYAQNGRRRYVLHSARITHRHNTDISRLTQVALNYFPPADPYWRLTAHRGRLLHNGDRIVLIDRVHAWQPGVAKPVHLETSRLTLRLDKRLISSNARVTIRHGARVIRGTGLRADLNRDRIKLLSEVTSRFQFHE